MGFDFCLNLRATCDCWFEVCWRESFYLWLLVYCSVGLEF